MQAANTEYISHQVALNKLVLVMLENYRYWLWIRGTTSEVLKTIAAVIVGTSTMCSIALLGLRTSYESYVRSPCKRGILFYNRLKSSNSFVQTRLRVLMSKPGASNF